MGRGRARVRAGRRQPRSGAPSGARARGSGRSGRGSRPRRACSPSLRSSAGEKRASSALVGGMCRPSVGAVVARMIRRSIARASLARISWPHSARRSAWATVPRRTGRSPRRRRTVRPISGSRWKRSTNGVWSSSIARQKRSSSSASSPVARRQTTPSGRCQATPRPAGSIAVRIPSRNVRVASPARRADSASEYGPRGRSSALTTTRE